MEALVEKLKAFVEKQAGYVEKYGSITISTSDHSNSDRDIWNHRHDIMAAMTKRGYSVTSKTNWGVLDISVTKPLSL